MSQWYEEAEKEVGLAVNDDNDEDENYDEDVKYHVSQDENLQVERDLALDISALDCSAPQVQLLLQNVSKLSDSL